MVGKGLGIVSYKISKRREALSGKFLVKFGCQKEVRFVL